jgi:hypothetical protein
VVVQLIEELPRDWQVEVLGRGVLGDRVPLGNYALDRLYKRRRFGTDDEVIAVEREFY